MNDIQKQPIFIVGSARSGTTLLRIILDSHPNICCGPESHFLIGFKELTETYKNRISKFDIDESEWLKSISIFFDDFYRKYAEKHGKKRWADKTPRYSAELEFLDKLFPECKFVHIVRDGRDVVLSYRDRWGYSRAFQGISNWRNRVTMAREFSKNISEDRYFEIRYENLVSQPEDALKPLFTFLNEPWDPNVLEYNRVSHDDVRSGYSSFTEKRRVESGERSLIYKSRVGAAQKKLDPFLKLVFRLKCTGLMKELGYYS